MICDKCIYGDTCLLYKREKEREEQDKSPNKIFFGCGDFKGVYKNDD